MADKWITNEKGMKVRADFYEPALTVEGDKITYAGTDVEPDMSKLMSQEELVEQQAQARPKQLMQKYMHVETRDHKIKSDMYALGDKEGWTRERVQREIELAIRKADSELVKKLRKAPLEARHKQLEEYARQHPQGEATKYGDKSQMDNMLRLILNMPPEYLDQLREILGIKGEGENV
jgi:hypothetical protein